MGNEAHAYYDYHERVLSKIRLMYREFPLWMCFVVKKFLVTHYEKDCTEHYEELFKQLVGEAFEKGKGFEV